MRSLAVLFLFLCGQEVVTAYPGPYPGSRIMGGSGVCAVFSESAIAGMMTSENAGIVHYYAGTYEKDYVKTCLPAFVLDGARLSALDSPITDLTIRPGTFFTETIFKSADSSLNDPAHVGFSYRTYSTVSGIIVFDIAIENASSEEKIITVKPLIAFRGSPELEKQEHDGAVFVVARFPHRHIGIGMTGPCKSDHPGELERHITIAPGKIERTRMSIVSTLPGSNLPPLTSCSFEEAQADWQSWINSGTRLPIADSAIRQAYATTLIALAATSLYGAVPADMTGQFVTNDMPQLYPRDALMTARALLECGFPDRAREIINFWYKSIPQKNPGEWYARYDAAARAVEGGSGAAYDVPEWDSNGDYACLLLRFFQKTGVWIGSYDLMKDLLDFVVSRQNADGLVEEGGIVEWVGVLPATNMNLAAGLKAGALACELHGERAKAAAYRVAAEKMQKGLRELFSLSRGAYMDVRRSDKPDHPAHGEEQARFNTSANFGFIWGYPNHFELASTNEWYRTHTHKLGGGVQYFEADGYGSDYFGFTTAASAQYHAATGDNDKYIEHVRWMMEHSNVYGLMPERIFHREPPDDREPDHPAVHDHPAAGLGVSPASPLSWCNGEFAAAVLEGARLGIPTVSTDTSYALDGILDEAESLERVIAALEGNQKLSGSVTIAAARLERDFEQKAVLVSKLLDSLSSLSASDASPPEIGWLLDRIRNNFQIIILNRLRLDNPAHADFHITADKIVARLNEPITLFAAGSHGDIDVTQTIVEQADGNGEVSSTSYGREGSRTFPPSSWSVVYTKGAPPYETAVRVTLVGRWKKIPVRISRVLGLRIVN